MHNTLENSRRAKREKQITTERSSCLLNGNNRGAGEAAQKMNTENYLKPLLGKKKKDRNNKSWLILVIGGTAIFTQNKDKIKQKQKGMLERIEA